MPPGVIQFLPGDGADVGDPVLASEHLAGLHFTGSTGTFNHLWHEIGTQPRPLPGLPARSSARRAARTLSSPTSSADPDAVATAIVRGSFEYQGQKCSAASRVYVDQAVWPAVQASLAAQMADITVGPVEDFSHFVNAVIDERAFDKITGYIDRATEAPTASRCCTAATHRKDDGYFVDPTVLVADDPDYETMEKEIFGPVASVYVSGPVVRRPADAGRPDEPLRAHRRRLRPGPRRARPRDRAAGRRGRQLLPQRQADRAPSSGSSRSAAPGARAPTTRPARS